MTDFDVFNGDADGLCALTQLRNAEPREAQLVTGVKRDINLLERVHAAPDSKITVLDVSLDKNRAGLERALALSKETTVLLEPATVWMASSGRGKENPYLGSPGEAV